MLNNFENLVLRWKLAGMYDDGFLISGICNYLESDVASDYTVELAAKIKTYHAFPDRHHI